MGHATRGQQVTVPDPSRPDHFGVVDRLLAGGMRRRQRGRDGRPQPRRATDDCRRRAERTDNRRGGEAGRSSRAAARSNSEGARAYPPGGGGNRSTGGRIQVLTIQRVVATARRTHRLVVGWGPDRHEWPRWACKHSRSGDPRRRRRWVGRPGDCGASTTGSDRRSTARQAFPIPGQARVRRDSGD